ncbi:3-deoxy-7-phosphoheptulonate synthase class II [Egibacter rhizosphaerae]|uniref:Phospho-2-dehydro-3-deoxyheptonate aldolase n=1 Tax=Egibacter rhizosphaerae TaxID=1670831 RepID=A0A411YAP6_9ACTN|nr:3-deoxy-7-phosphoheptulonate synthase class II [Egibacter rhizosphaerae]QBI18252.1 3-deoxy-7-phosphoheptulonate synthase class II [Egibacter rhizosphaerae]
MHPTIAPLRDEGAGGGVAPPVDDRTWTPSSWRARPAWQQPTWPDGDALAATSGELSALPPLVFAGEARALRSQLAAVGRGEAFLLQGGDCAETFAAFGADAIRDKLKVLLQMAVALTYGAQLPVVKVGRIAGQFAKPRSGDTETRDGVELPVYRGDAVNALEFSEEARTPDPHRLVQVYHQAAATLNLLRAFTRGGFADLERVQQWNQQFVAESPQGRRYEQLAEEITRALAFLKACGVDVENDPTFHTVDFWTSHEALLLEYEEALTRRDSLTGQWYDCSAHMLWIGERTRQLDGAHVEFLSGVGNPIGVKLGPKSTVDEVEELAARLNPEGELGRLTLISRMGAQHAGDRLPELVRAVRDRGLPVVWSCDPMHGNTFTSDNGFKTRHFEDVLTETRTFFAVHAEEGTVPGGIHVELTGEDVTECLGGAQEIVDGQLGTRYESACDPRLNNRQALEMAFQVAELLRTDESG